jgi:RNA polymerase sigma-70 factor (ECF subfamily)
MRTVLETIPDGIHPAAPHPLWGILQQKDDSPPRMATEKELSSFLEAVERKAFKQAVYAVRKDEAALDIVQDAMIKLAEKYGDKPAAELPMLFQRILQNTIHDYFRREKVRNGWISLFSGLGNDPDDSENFDLLETYEAEEGTEAAESSADKVEREQVLAVIDEEIQKLPARQREAFLMRYWQDMDVAETAAAMGCSEGSVKTHCSRATHALAQALKARGITL